MSSLKKGVRESDLLDQNHELVQAVQNWKMVAGEKEKHILKLTKEANDLKIQMSILRNKGCACARKLETAVQKIGETALSHLVQGSNAVASIIELIKNYMREREELEISSRQPLIDSTPNTERVQRVPPLMLEGKSIQPVVSLSRAMLPDNSLIGSNGSNENYNRQDRPLPMRIFPVYIPLTRIDVNMTPPDIENNQDTSVEDMGLDEENGELSEEEDGPNTPTDDHREKLSVLLEESEESRTPSIADPLEGPSRLLDTPNFNGPIIDQSTREFTPTMRRRKRISSPRAVELSPILIPRHVIPRHKTHGRILKVLVAKMRFEDDNAGVSPAKKEKIEARKSDKIGSSQDIDTSEKANSSQDKPLSPRHNANSPRHKSVPPWEKPGSSKDKHVSPWANREPSRDGSPWEKLSSSRNECNSPWHRAGSVTEKASSPHHKSVPPWEKPGSSKDKHVSPWDNREPSRDGSPWEKRSSSRNECNSPWHRAGSAIEKANSSLENDCMAEVSSHSAAQESVQGNSPNPLLKNRRQKRTVSREHESSGESSQSNLRIQKGMRDRRKTKDSPGKFRNDIYRFSINSENNEDRPEFDAPSPNGATNTRVIVQEAQIKIEPESRPDIRTVKRNTSTDTVSECSDDVPETRSRRVRKPVTYKENLKGKLRR
ncbi:uncharacterized protein LOC110991303 isoform X2 [Pieris rapae]|uniref:uncharacterized protein LOC110991303 isoform X2 n=1 Tax=Pieris rapae TaxID=64459 RepID=UPI001E28118E|nr:uncharacterized protein LOC110991303 isoform X2 [Pieris rapae]